MYRYTNRLVLGGVLIIFSLCACSRHRIVHLSIDDVVESMESLTYDSLKYESVFNEPFFSYLLMLHDRYDAAFTLYLYQQSNSFCIEKFPIKYKKELSTHSKWLKFAFHAKEPGMTCEEISNIEMFEESFYVVSNSIENFSSINNKAKIVRLEYFYASKQEVSFLLDNGVEYLLTADDNRMSYSNGGGNRVVKTDQRLENINNINTFLFSCLFDDTLVIFTHEKFLYQESYKNKFEDIIKGLGKVKFLCE